MTLLPETEGTIVFDGLLQGPLPSSSELRALIEKWVSTAGKLVRFSIDFEPGGFSVLVSDVPVPVKAFTEPPQEQARVRLEELVRLLPKEAWPQLTSTIRSVEYRAALKVETLYAAMPDGSIATREREVDWKPEVVVPPVPGQRPSLRKLALMAAGVVAMIVILTLAGFWSMFSGVSSEGIRLETSHAEPYLDFEFVEIDSRVEGIGIQVSRGKGFPSTLKGYEEQLALLRKKDDLPGFLMLRAVAAGTIHIEYLDEEGRVFNDIPIRVKGLMEGKKVKGFLPINRKHRPAVLRITY